MKWRPSTRVARLFRSISGILGNLVSALHVQWVLVGAQAMSKVVPFKDWNDIVRSKKLPDIDYKVKLYRRPSVKRGYPVYDARLTPITTNQEGN